MFSRSFAACTFFIVFALCSPAHAAITAFWVPVASGDGSVGSVYPAAATTAPAGDPLLLSMQTWDLRVTTDGNWSSAGLRATLPGGSFFYRRLSDGTTSNGLTKPDPSLYPIFPNREFWTYVTAPDDTFGSGKGAIGKRGHHSFLRDRGFNDGQRS